VVLHATPHMPSQHVQNKHNFYLHFASLLENKLQRSVTIATECEKQLNGTSKRIVEQRGDLPENKGEKINGVNRMTSIPVTTACG
jgi:hypothetical protein